MSSRYDTLHHLYYKKKNTPPSFLWEALEAENCPEITMLGKIIAQKRCKYHCFCLFWLVAMENVVFEVVGFYGVLMCFMHMFSQNTVNTSASEEVV